MIPLDTLTTPMTKEQVLERLLSLLETLQIPARSWNKAGALRTILVVVAIVYAQFSVLVTQAIRACFLDLAEGSWLTLHAYYVFGVTRKPALFATGFVRVTNDGVGTYTFNPDQFRVLWPITTTKKKAYVNSALFTLNPGESKLVAIRAVEIGTASSAAPLAISELETFYPGVTVKNEAAVWGADEEIDEELRERCRAKRSTASVGGPRGAYFYAVTSALRNDGTFVNINRAQVSTSSSTGIVTTYVAAPNGTPIPEDIEAAAENVEAIARPDAVRAPVLAATAVPLSRSLVLWARRSPGVTAADIKAAAEVNLEREMRVYPIGGIPKSDGGPAYLYADRIAAFVGAHPSVFDVDGTGADLQLLPGQVAVLEATIEVRIVGAT